MKKLLLSTLAALVTLGAFAQRQAENRPNMTSIRVAGYEILLEPDGEVFHGRSARLNRHNYRKYDGHIGVWELGFNGLKDFSNFGAYSMYPESYEGFMDLRQGRSFHITLNAFTWSTSFTRSNWLGLTMGLGLTSNDYTFETTSAFVEQDKKLYPVAVDHHLKKAKLNTLAIHVPIALEVSPTRSFFFSVGAYADILVGSHMKWKFPKEKLRGVDTNFLQAGATVRVGFRRIYAFGNFALTELFRSGHGPALTPYSFGIGFGL